MGYLRGTRFISHQYIYTIVYIASPEAQLWENTMFRHLSAVSLAVALLALATPSNAQTFSGPSGSFSPTGTLTYGSFPCTITATAALSANTVAFTYRELTGSPFCGSLSWFRPVGTWSVTPNTTSTVLLTIGAVTVPGNCYGTIVANWDNTTNEIWFDNVAIAPALGSICVYSGRIKLPGFTIS